MLFLIIIQIQSVITGVQWFSITRKEQLLFSIPNKTDDNFYVCTVHLDTTKVYFSPTNAQVIVLKIILKFTLK